jgi:cell wall-associated NlpC family hydrolase
LKKIAILGSVIVLLGCSAATFADNQNRISTTKYEYLGQKTGSLSLLETARYMTMLEEKAYELKQKQIAEAKRQVALIKNQRAIESNIDKLNKYVNKTRYVFSGSTPRGWDCSGLVRWFYGELGIEVPHSASKQGLMKPKVKNPLPGDIVVFKYNNAKNFIHSGIYIGNNKIIHAGFKKGQATEVISLDDPAFDGQKHYFVRVLELPNEQ